MVRQPLTPEQVAAGRRLGEVLRAARGDRSLPEVASMARMSPETLRKIEAGRLPSPAFGSIVLLCRALDLDLDLAAEAWLRELAAAYAG